MRDAHGNGRRIGMERIDVPCAAGRTTSATVLPTAGDARRPCRAYTNLTHRGRHRELHACTSFDADRHALWYGEAGSGIRRGSIEGTVVVPRGRVAMPLESDRRRCDAVIPLVDSRDEQVCAGVCRCAWTVAGVDRMVVQVSNRTKSMRRAQDMGRESDAGRTPAGQVARCFAHD